MKFTPTQAPMHVEQIAAEIEEAMDMVVDREYCHEVDAARLPADYCQRFVDEYYKTITGSYANEDESCDAETEMMDRLVREYFALPHTPKPPNLVIKHVVVTLVEQYHELYLDPALVWRSPGEVDVGYLDNELERQLPQEGLEVVGTRIFDHTSGDVIFEDRLYRDVTTLRTIREAAK